MKPISFILPLRLIASSNAREHFRVTNQRKKEQRGYANLFTSSIASSVTFPVVVTLTRIGKRKMDSDNLAISAKYVRDGVSDGLKVDDGDDSKITWVYRQEIGSDYGCRVLIEGAR